MGHLSQNLLRASKDAKLDRLNDYERRAVDTTLDEAAASGADLKHKGVGGVPPSLALGIYRKCGYRCQTCGSKEQIALHHRSGLQSSPWKEMGKPDRMGNFTVLCDTCHNALHQQEKENT